MFKLFLLVVVLVALVDAMPKPQEMTDKQSKAPAKIIRYCQPQTPCGWKIYNYMDYPEIKLTNDYCSCKTGHKCQAHESRPQEGYIEYRCKLFRDLN